MLTVVDHLGAEKEEESAEETTSLFCIRYGMFSCKFCVSQFDIIIQGQIAFGLRIVFSCCSTDRLISENKFVAQQRKHHSPLSYIKTMIINPLPSNRGFHSNCAALSLKCCKRTMMIYPVKSVFVFSR